MANKKEDPGLDGVLSTTTAPTYAYCTDSNATDDTNAASATVEADLPWTATVDWWTSPALAYAAGLHDGARLERERIAQEDDQLHRQAVRAALVSIERIDRRQSRDLGRAA